MNSIINLAFGGYGCYILYLFSQGRVATSMFGVDLGPIGYPAVVALITAYCFYNVYKGNRHRF